MGIIISNWVLRTSLLQASSIDRVADQLGCTFGSKEFHKNSEFRICVSLLEFQTLENVQRLELHTTQRHEIICAQIAETHYVLHGTIDHYLSLNLN